MGLTGRRTGRKSSIMKEDFALRLQRIIYSSVILSTPGLLSRCGSNHNPSCMCNRMMHTHLVVHLRG